MHLKHVLGEIDANRDNLHVDGSLIVIRFRQSPYGTSMPRAGAVHHIKSGRKQMQHCALTEFWSLLDQPVVPREECLSGTAAEVTTHAARSPVRGRPRYRGALTIRQVNALAVEPLFICRAMPPLLPRRKPR